MSKIALEGNASGTGTFTIASPNSNSNYTLTLPSSTGTVVVTGGAQTIEFAAGTAAAPSITFTGDINTGIFSPGADTIAFSEGGAEAMRIDSSGNVGIGTTSPTGAGKILHLNNSGTDGADVVDLRFTTGTTGATSGDGVRVRLSNAGDLDINNLEAKAVLISTQNTERMRIDSSGNVGIGTSSMTYPLEVSAGNGYGIRFTETSNNVQNFLGGFNSAGLVGTLSNHPLQFWTNNSEKARITSGGDFLVGKTSDTGNGAGITLGPSGYVRAVRSNELGLLINRLSSDGTLVSFEQDTVAEGSISVSGNTVSYNAFSGAHWSQLQQGRGYNPDILRGTVMSSIGEMCKWKSVTWTETIEHPAVLAVDAKETVLDEEGNVIEPAVEAVEGKDAWTETIQHRKAYLGSLTVGATFEEDGVTKTVVDDGNERLPKVKISDVVGDKAVYGVFQTWDEVQDMLVTSLGAFVVRIAAGVTVQIGDLLESNGDGCAKVQDDDVIRSKTIGKVTSTTPSATYADGSYTVPAVLYCG